MYSVHVLFNLSANIIPMAIISLYYHEKIGKKIRLGIGVWPCFSSCICIYWICLFFWKVSFWGRGTDWKDSLTSGGISTHHRHLQGTAGCVLLKQTHHSLMRSTDWKTKDKSILYSEWSKNLSNLNLFNF